MLTEQELAQKLAPIPSIWLSLEERMCLLKYAGLSKGDIIEIGTAWGGSACILALGSADNRLVISVDHYPENLRKVDGWDITAEGAYGKIHEVLGARASHWSQWVMPSIEAAKIYGTYYSSVPAGLVFIDGDHSYEAVHQDVSLWLPLIQPHGFLILHDSCRDPNQPEGSNLCGYPGPTQVAQELSYDPRVKLIETAYSTTVWEVQ